MPLMQIQVVATQMEKHFQQKTEIMIEIVEAAQKVAKVLGGSTTVTIQI